MVFANHDAEEHAGAAVSFVAQLVEADDFRLPGAVCVRCQG